MRLSSFHIQPPPLRSTHTHMYSPTPTPNHPTTRQVRLSSFHIKLADTHQTESSFVHLYEAVPKKSVAQLAGLKPPYVKRCGGRHYIDILFGLCPYIYTSLYTIECT